MKATELRIGNLVYYNGNHNEVGIVSEILKNDLSKVSPYKIGINHRIDIHYDIDTLKPIPINEYWLFKYGYKKENELFENESRLSIWTDKKSFDGFMADWGDKVIGEVKYLHQLQNLYCILCASELELNS